MIVDLPSLDGNDYCTLLGRVIYILFSTLAKGNIWVAGFFKTLSNEQFTIFFLDYIKHGAWALSMDKLFIVQNRILVWISLGKKLLFYSKRIHIRTFL